jgi:glutamine synthetase
VNWSLSTDTGVNLLEPGDTPHENMMFLFFCAAVIRAVDKHADLLRISVASASNDHRLGANEAPPAIISIFLGTELTDVFERIVSGREGARKSAGLLGLGTPVLPPLPLHTGDRNRTSPFAFTGNKFEFRAVGSSQSVSFPVTVLNTIVAESVADLTRSIEAGMKKRQNFESALRDVLKETYAMHQRVVFNGDGYDHSWHAEAEQRGLPNLRTSVEAIEQLTAAKNVKLFTTHNVLTKRELEARQEVMFDQYFKTVNIEAETTEWMSQTMILPAMLRYVETVHSAASITRAASTTATRVVEHLDALGDALDVLHRQNLELGGDDLHSKCQHMLNNVLPAMQAVRLEADQLERLCDHALWPMPVYREMLFVK